MDGPLIESRVTRTYSTFLPACPISPLLIKEDQVRPPQADPREMKNVCLVLACTGMVPCALVDPQWPPKVTSVFFLPCNIQTCIPEHEQWLLQVAGHFCGAESRKWAPKWATAVTALLVSQRRRRKAQILQRPVTLLSAQA